MESKKILLIDDAEDLRESMVEILELKGYHAIAAPRGEIGVEMALKEHPDLIFVDLRMPDIDGFEVIRRIRADQEWGAHAHILILTASGESDEIPDDIELDKNDFLMKTEWGLHNIEEKIKEKLGAF